MKKIWIFFTLAFVFSVTVLIPYTAVGENIGGPKGGRLLEKTNPKAEFYVEKDNSVIIVFYDDNLQPISAADQNVTVIANVNDVKTLIEFEKTGGVLLSKGKLPEGDGYGLVVQFRQTAEATPQNFRFKLEAHICDGCGRVEYACICDE